MQLLLRTWSPGLAAAFAQGPKTGRWFQICLLLLGELGWNPHFPGLLLFSFSFLDPTASPVWENSAEKAGLLSPSPWQCLFCWSQMTVPGQLYSHAPTWALESGYGNLHPGCHWTASWEHGPRCIPTEWVKLISLHSHFLLPKRYLAERKHSALKHPAKSSAFSEQRDPPIPPAAPSSVPGR